MKTSGHAHQLWYDDAETLRLLGSSFPFFRQILFKFAPAVRTAFFGGGTCFSENESEKSSAGPDLRSPSFGGLSPRLQSMRRISASEAGSVVPRRLDIVTAGRGDTVRTLAARMAYTDAQEARFRVLNGLSSRDQVVPGRQYKIVVRSN